ncbi:MAG: N-succinyldiaminopimelate aminotransferase [Halieaceae bacterium]|jgi:N-succinyldiaminopimelate aminotransferase
MHKQPTDALDKQSHTEMNPDLDLLHPYPFEKLRHLLLGVNPPAAKTSIALSIGEPAHAAPQAVLDALTANLGGVSKYPSTKGIPELRSAIAHWLQRRFKLAGIDPDSQILPVSGTREAIFSFAQAAIDRSFDALVLCPNPFYQIYEGAAYLAGAQPLFLNCSESNNFQPELDQVSEAQWHACQIFYLCSPGNPTGTVLDREYIGRLLELSDKHDFIIASDECYSEIFADEERPPTGLLQVCAELGRDDYSRCIVFHSLSKRSNLPGLRSGFVAGDATILSNFLLYRTYHGSAMPLQHQLASIVAWSDEDHVIENRRYYREKFTAVYNILSPVIDVCLPDAGFYLWPKTPITGQEFARGLYQQQGVTVLPGEFISRDSDGCNPGMDRVRMALVPPLADCITAAQRIREYVGSL